MRVSRNAGIDVRGGFASITVAEPGPYDIKVNGEKEWFDAVTGKSVGNGPVLFLNLEAGDTKVMIDEAVMDRVHSRDVAN